MRINGQVVEGMNEDVLVLPRAKGNIVFQAVAIHDYDEFEKMVPVPVPPKVLTKNGSVADPEDEGYQSQIVNYGLQRLAYMAINSLAPSNIEWTKVVLNKPNTWANWTEELAAVLSVAEQKELLNFILAVNTLDQRKIEEARANFLAGRAQGTAH